MKRNATLAFLFTFPVLLVLTAFCVATPGVLWSGMRQIVASPSLLLTDYLAVGGLGATLLNAGLCGLIAAALTVRAGVDINGPFIAAVYTIIGFAFFGKNVLNMWPIFSGVWLYTRYQGMPYRNALLVALFGTTLAPLVSFFAVSTELQGMFGIPLGILLGLAAGFILPPLASHMLRFHDGFNIYNIGFTGGMIGSFFIATLRSVNFTIAPTALFENTHSVFLGWFLAIVFLALILTGVVASRHDVAESVRAMRLILRSSGRLVSDFTQIGNYPATLVNMGVMGLISLGFVSLLGGKLNGPVVGGILTVVGFAAFGKHPKNCLPILLGVVLAAICKIWELTATTAIIAGLFGTTLAPVAGQYGALAGIVAGFFHLSIVMNVGVLHGGINLYNNGFAGGFVASLLVPLLESLKRNGVKDET